MEARSENKPDSTKPACLVRMASALMGSYLRWCPLQKGKWWIRRKVSSWVIARLDTGPWIRVSGVADFEWRVLLGAESGETKTARQFADLLKPGQVVVDVGANVGFYSLLAAQRVGPSGRVIAFEPNLTAAARLRENISLNGFGNITVVEVAVADQPGTLRFNCCSDSEGSSLYSMGYYTPAATLEVPVTTLDNYCFSMGVTRVDVLKIDAEGAEVAVILGARRLLSPATAPTVIVEANPLTLKSAGQSEAALRAALVSMGYTPLTIEGEEWNGVTVENWLATKRREDS